MEGRMACDVDVTTRIACRLVCWKAYKTYQTLCMYYDGMYLRSHTILRAQLCVEANTCSRVLGVQGVMGL
jgi:hypothetical protein